jgi:GNAT superfamily N-acetyltransferase
MSHTIRAVTNDDWQALSDLNVAVYEFLMSAEELKDEEESFPAHIKHQRWVAEVEGKVVAGGRYFQHVGRYHPQKFRIEIDVHPDLRGRGIGRALYNTVMAAIAPFDPISIQTNAREDWAASFAALAKEGFVEKMRTWENKLDLAQFDPAPFAGTLRKVEELGYRLVYLREMGDDLAVYRKLYDTVHALRADVPATDPSTPIPFEHWLEKQVKGEVVWAWLVAVKDGEFAGVTQLFTTDEAQDMLHTGLTGVMREHRGAGVAYALKVKSLMDAKAAGYNTVLTWNESNNRRMLAVNERVGFVRQPAWVDFVKTIKAE